MAGKKNKRAQGSSASRNCWWVFPVSCFMLLVLAAASLLIIHEVGEYRRFRVMREAVDTGGYYTGIVVEGYDLSGVSRENVRKHWDDTVEPFYRDRALTLTSGGQSWTVTPPEIGYSSNYDEVLDYAWSRGRSGTLETRYRAINQIRTAPERYEVLRTLFDPQMLRAWTDKIAESLTVKPVDAVIERFDVESRQFTFGSSAPGRAVNADELFASASKALSAGSASIPVDIIEVAPEVTPESFEGHFGMITQAVTNASGSSGNRLTNLKLACEAINGYCLNPGETFSYNEVVGQRTKARGYKLATVYQQGEIAEDIGGGVCQVSTTLWNAAMKANCESVERHEHSRPVSYVDRGKDATVNWGTQDMKFKNISDSPMYVIAYVTNKRVYCEIYGRLLPDGEYITVEAKTTQKIEPGEPIYNYSPLLSSGQSVVVSEARTGYRASAYRVYWSADGAEISRELLCNSYYKPARAEIDYG